MVSEDGQAVLMQQVQQSAQQMPPTPDIEMATKTEFTNLGSHVMSNMKNLLDLSTIKTSSGIRSMPLRIKCSGSRTV